MCKISTSWQYLQENGTHTQTKTKRNIPGNTLPHPFPSACNTSNQLKIQKICLDHCDETTTTTPREISCTGTTPGGIITGFRRLLYWSLAKHGLVGGFNFNPSEKYATVKLDHFPRDRDEHKKYLKPPPRWNLGCEKQNP